LDKIEKLHLRIIDVTCATCIIPIRKKLMKTNGVKFVGSNYVTNFIFVEYDPKIISNTEIIQRIKDFGYDTIQIYREN